MIPTTLLGRIFAAVVVVSAAVGAFQVSMKWAEQRGYERRDAQARIELAKGQEALAQEREANARDALRRTERFNEQMAELGQRAEKLQRELRHALSKEPVRVVLQPSTPASTPANALADPAAVLLGPDAVGLLNLARLGPAADLRDGSPAAGALAESRAAAAAGNVTLADLAVADQNLASQYHRLAARHDSLVEWVRAQCLRP